MISSVGCSIDLVHRRSEGASGGSSWHFARWTNADSHTARAGLRTSADQAIVLRVPTRAQTPRVTVTPRCCPLIWRRIGHGDRRDDRLGKTSLAVYHGVAAERVARLSRSGCSASCMKVPLACYGPCWA
jgi:hypothetical protein